MSPCYTLRSEFSSSQSKFLYHPPSGDEIEIIEEKVTLVRPKFPTLKTPNSIWPLVETATYSGFCVVSNSSPVRVVIIGTKNWISSKKNILLWKIFLSCWTNNLRILEFSGNEGSNHKKICPQELKTKIINSWFK